MPDLAVLRVPPLQLVDTTEYRYTPLYEDEEFLRQKYLVERLSVAQIGIEICSAKTTVLRALRRFRIPLRANDTELRRSAQIAFGKKKREGKVVPHLAEQRIINAIHEMRRQGMSTPQIAKVLTEMKVPTKLRGRAWHPEMVRRTLKRKLP